MLPRNEVALDDQWNVASLYKSHEEWKNDFESNFPSQKNLKWPEMAAFQGKLGSDLNTLKKALTFFLTIQRKIERLYTYSHLRHDEDITNDQYKIAHQKIMGLAQAFSSESSWFEPELLALPSEIIDAILQSPDLKEYRFYLEKILRMKSHTLSTENEMLLSLSEKALQVAQKTFSAINDADFKFGNAQNKHGEELPITHATFGLYIRSPDRILRENVFKNYHNTFLSYENTLCELLQGQVQKHLFNAKARKYNSCLKAALYPNNIDLSVYHSLIQAVNENLDTLHEYVNLRKEMLGLDQIHLYDMHVPITKEFDISLSYEEAESLIIESVAPLGNEYKNILYKGLKEDRWVDRYENKNKRSGAYSSGCYDSMPYILMNYKGILRDVFTLAHEAGHSMHSYLSHKHQPFHYGNYSIFLAEVASTFNEDLLTRLMLARSSNAQEKIFLINQKIEDIRATLFRQTMFAEFELMIHDSAENEIPLTPRFLKEKYLELNTRYFGPNVIIDPEIAIEWARIPHFYYNFYVYQYATGISASLALSDRVVNGGSQEREDYLSFLKGGSSKYPIELLKIAGVDMTTEEPVNQAIKKFRALVEELKLLTLERV